MLNTNEWFIVKGGVSEDTCDKIKHLAKGEWEDSSVEVGGAFTDHERTHGRDREYKTYYRKRKSDVAWTSEQWAYDAIWPYMLRANQESGWRYDVSSAEGMQITRYREGGFYAFHRDGYGDHLSAYDQPDNKFIDGKVRKLSMTLSLGGEYEGGDFQFRAHDTNGKCIISSVDIKEKGTMVFFPSYAEHRVTPVTSGIRYSLVSWFLGPPFV